MILSENFTLQELTSTNTGLVNDPREQDELRLLYLANYILQPIRDRWGRISINSAFRSPLVNSKVGGSPTSQHLTGSAADFITPESKLEDVYRWIVNESRIPFGQCIYELRETGDWIHISLVRLNGMNQIALVSPSKGKYISYQGRVA